MGIRRRSRILTVGTVAIATVMTLTFAVVPASGAPTVQDQSPVQASVMVQDPGRLVARGAAVDVTVEYQCVPGAQIAGLFVEARQVFARNVAQGFGFVDGGDLGACIGFVPQHITVRVDAGFIRFKPGTALVNATLEGYDPFFEWFFVSDDAEIRFTKKKN